VKGFVIWPGTDSGFSAKGIQCIATTLLLGLRQGPPVTVGDGSRNPSVNDMTDWNEREGLQNIGRKQSPPKHRQATCLPEGFDISVVECLVEAFPKRKKCAEQASVNDAEQQDQFTRQASQFFIFAQHRRRPYSGSWCVRSCAACGLRDVLRKEFAMVELSARIGTLERHIFQPGGFS
jgi:hypothetical protein